MAEPKVTMHFDDKNLQRILKKFAKLPKDIQEDVSKVIDSGAKQVRTDAKSYISKAPKKVVRYKNGEEFATYYPGNLRKSIRILDRRLKKAKEPSAFVGPLFRKRNFGGDFGKTSRVDPYYFLFYELGTSEQVGNDTLGKAKRKNENNIKSGLTKAVSKVIEKANRK